MSKSVTSTSVSDEQQFPALLFTFQQGYALHLREPKTSTLPLGVPERQSQVYESLLFNNVCGFIDKCFPVAKSLFNDDQWRQLCRAFFRDWQAQTPYFSEIPAEFVRFIQQGGANNTLAPWFTDLVHYEWIELAVDTHPACIDWESRGLFTPEQLLCINPTAYNLHYPWPVHKIGRHWIPEQTEDTFLLVYRNEKHGVQFMNLNPVTAVLLQQVSETPSLALPLLKTTCALVQHPDEAAFVSFGLELLQTLWQKGVLI